MKEDVSPANYPRLGCLSLEAFGFRVYCRQPLPNLVTSELPVTQHLTASGWRLDSLPRDTGSRARSQSAIALVASSQPSVIGFRLWARRRPSRSMSRVRFAPTARAQRNSR